MKKHIVLATLAACAAFTAFAAPANAAAFVCSPSGDWQPDAVACVGATSGNQLNSANLAAQQAALADLGYAWDTSTFSSLEKVTKPDPDTPLTIVDFTSLLFGETYIGFFAGGPDGGTAIYKFDFATPIDILTWTHDNKGSDAILYSTQAPIPEPASWAMLIAGMSAVGFAMRRRKVDVSFA